ncbi:endospore germination permease [Paenibacillus sp. HJGM_3]|uniref:GerAB/ArcD/ProY family transporter n=1 Tax=Paenibacillus sp. HJGM_3 TaxID=3379816 RepID=UPI00385B7329
MENPRQITAIQASLVMISTIIGVGVLPLPLFAARAGGSGAPLVTIIGIAVALCGLVLITRLGQRFPHQTIIEYSEDIVGKLLGRIGSVLIILFFAVLTSLAAREFGEVVVTSVLKKTPLEVTVIVMLLLSALSTRSSMTTFTYIHHFYFPLLVFPAILIVALSLKNANVLFLQPVWGTGEWGSMFRGGLTIAALFQGSFVMTMVIPFMRNPSRVMKSACWAIVIAGGLYLSIVTATVSVFGSDETIKLLWPTLELAKTTSLPANILERLDAAFLAVWVTAVFTTLFSTYYFMNHALSRLLRLKDHRMFAMMTLPFVFVIAMLPQNVLNMYEIIQVVGQIGLLITVGYPLLLLVVARFRKKGGDIHGGQNSAESRSGNET